MGAEKRCLISRDDIARRVEELAGEISRDYAGRDLVMVGVLKGAFIFLADLVRELSLPGGNRFCPPGQLWRRHQPHRRSAHHQGCGVVPQGRDVLIVEDIMDIGLTLDFLKQHLASHQPRSLKICCLIDKRERREVEVPLDYVGFRGGEGLPGGLRPGLRGTEAHPAGDFCVGEGLRLAGIIWWGGLRPPTGSLHKERRGGF